MEDILLENYKNTLCDKSLFEMSESYLENNEFSKAFDLAYVSAKRFYLPAIRKIAYFFENGIGVKKDEIISHKYYQIASSKGDLIAKRKYAIQTIQGIGCEPDYKKGMQLLIENGNCGDGISYLQLAKIYLQGKYTQKNLDLYFKYLNLANDLGSKNTNMQLALCYLNGIGTNINEQKAFSYFLKGAESKEDKCYYYLGVLYSKGQGVSKDHAKAFYYYKKGCDAKDPKAIYNLATFYEFGYYVEENKKTAYYLYNLSYVLGFDVALKKREELKKYGE